MGFLENAECDEDLFSPSDTCQDKPLLLPPHAPRRPGQGAAVPDRLWWLTIHLPPALLAMALVPQVYFLVRLRLFIFVLKDRHRRLLQVLAWTCGGPRRDRRWDGYQLFQGYSSRAPPRARPRGLLEGRRQLHLLLDVEAKRDLKLQNLILRKASASTSEESECGLVRHRPRPKGVH